MKLPIALSLLFGFLLVACGSGPASTPSAETPDLPPPTAPPAETVPPTASPDPTPAAGTPLPTMPAGPTALPQESDWTTYRNTELGYRIQFPGDWIVDEYGLSQPNRELIVNPPQAEPFVSYLSISIGTQSLQQIREAYAAHSPNVAASEVIFAGRPALQFTHDSARIEIYLEQGGYTFRVATDRWSLIEMQEIFSSFEFVSS